MESQTKNTINTKFWTDEEDVILRQFWGEISTKEIGAKLGRPKNSIISRAHRIGLPGYSPVVRRAAQVANQKVAVKAKRNRNSMFFKVKLGPVRSPTPKLLDIQPLNGVGVGFFDLQADSCRWMLADDKSFCGHKVKHGQNFCSDHYSVAYKPVPGRNVRNGYR